MLKNVGACSKVEVDSLPTLVVIFNFAGDDTLTKEGLDQGNIEVLAPIFPTIVLSSNSNRYFHSDNFNFKDPTNYRVYSSELKFDGDLFGKDLKEEDQEVFELEANTDGKLKEKRPDIKKSYELTYRF